MAARKMTDTYPPNCQTFTIVRIHCHGPQYVEHDGKHQSSTSGTARNRTFEYKRIQDNGPSIPALNEVLGIIQAAPRTVENSLADVEILESDDQPGHRCVGEHQEPCDSGRRQKNKAPDPRLRYFRDNWRAPC